MRKARYRTRVNDALILVTRSATPAHVAVSTRVWVCVSLRETRDWTAVAITGA